MLDLADSSKQSLADQLAATFNLFADHDGCVAVLAKDLRWPGRSHPVAEAGYFDRESLDLFIQEVSQRSGLAAALYISLNPVHTDLLALSHRRFVAGVQAPKDEHVVRLRTLLVDVDVKTRVAGISSSDGEKTEAWQLASSVGEHLRARGFAEPVVADSGNGYHLLYKVDLPTEDASLLRSVLTKLSEEKSSEICKIDTSVFNPARFTKLYGTLVRKGDPVGDRIHRFSRILSVPSEWTPTSRENLVRFAGDESTTAASRPDPVPRIASETRLFQATQHASRLEPAISGRGGHNTAFYVACRVGPGFDLTPEQAFAILRDAWNPRCEPPWSDAELRRKVEEAFAREERRGFMLRRPQEGHIRQQLEPLPGPIFPCALPDFLLSDSDRFLFELPESFIEPGRGQRFEPFFAFECLKLLEAQRQRRRATKVPDELVRACLWGASRSPTDWRKRLRAWFGQTEEEKARDRRHIPQRREEFATTSAHEEVAPTVPIGDELRRAHDIVGRIQSAVPYGCDDLCPMHSSSYRHRHFVDNSVVESRTALDVFWTRAADEWTFDLDKRREDGSKWLTAVRSRLYYAYLPIELFGPSPKVRIPVRQIRLFQGILREKTRTATARRSAGAVQAVVIQDARVAAGSGDATVVCPFLEADRSYALFGGNLGHRRGRGYRILGRNRTGWLWKAGYPVDAQTTDEQITAWTKKLLGDFAALASKFEFVTCGVNRDGLWKSLDEMRELVKTPHGRSRLAQLQVRVFAPENHLELWRHWFARKLGFSYIPGGSWAPPPNSIARRRFTGPEDVLAWLRCRGMTQKALANAIGRSAGLVSGYLSGSSRWSPKFEALVERYAESVDPSVRRDRRRVNS